MARPRVFDPSERRDLHVYLNPQQLQFILETAHKSRQSPSKIIRDFIDEMKDRFTNERTYQKTI